MLDAGKILSIEILQLAIEVAQADVFAQLVVGTGIAEVTGLIAAVAIGHDGHAVARIAQLETLQIPAGDGEVVDVSAADLGALVSLGQQPRIVVDQHRSLGQQRAVFERGLGHPGLGGHPCAGKLVGGATVVMHR